MRRKPAQVEDDPFLAGTTSGAFDADDPFDLHKEKEDLRVNLLPLALLPLPLSFCPAGTILRAACVNRTWHEAADNDKVWKALAKAKWGGDVVKESKSYCKQLGWKLAYFVGLCKTVLVNTPGRQVLALIPYPGLTIRDMCNAIGTEKVHHVRISSTSFCDSLTQEIEENDADGKGCWPSLAEAVLANVLVEPVSTIYIESVRRRRSTHDSDDEEAAGAGAGLKQQVEEQAKAVWKQRALAKLRNQPRFVLRKMQSHWAASLGPALLQSLTQPQQQLQQQQQQQNYGYGGGAATYGGSVPASSPVARPTRTTGAAAAAAPPGTGARVPSAAAGQAPVYGGTGRATATAAPAAQAPGVGARPASRPAGTGTGVGAGAAPAGAARPGTATGTRATTTTTLRR